MCSVEVCHPLVGQIDPVLSSVGVTPLQVAAANVSAPSVAAKKPDLLLRASCKRSGCALIFISRLTPFANSRYARTRFNVSQMGEGSGAMEWWSGGVVEARILRIETVRRLLENACLIALIQQSGQPAQEELNLYRCRHHKRDWSSMGVLTPGCSGYQNQPGCKHGLRSMGFYLLFWATCC